MTVVEPAPDRAAAASPLPARTISTHQPSNHPSDTSVLDNPAWHALTGPHARFAQRRGDAVRYHPDVSVFTALPDGATEQDWHDLAQLVGPGEVIPVTGSTVVPPAGWEVVESGKGVQMIAESLAPQSDPEAVVLGASDVPEMLALVERTKPGPFKPRTVELGTYLGIRREGRLIAMAGQRLRPPGWTEISAVCTDADFRGQGLGGRLVRAVAHDIVTRGDRVLLHASAANTTAIRLYEQLGFVLRKHTSFVALRTPRA